MTRLDEIRERHAARLKGDGQTVWATRVDDDVAWLLAEVERLQFKGIEDCRVLHGYLNDRDVEIVRRDKVLDQVRVAFRACFAPDFGGWDWRDDDAVQTLARSLSRALASLNTSSAEVTP